MPNLHQRVKSAFEMLFRPSVREMKSYFRMLDGYTPSWTTYDGGIYEMELTRSCIHAFAAHASKLLPTVSGADLRGIQRILDAKPNFFQNTAQFLYKTATIYEAQNTAWIVPVLDRFDRITGFYPLDPMQTEIVTVSGSTEPWLRYTFADGSKGAMELSRCGVVSKYLYHSDLIGETNSALAPTLQLLDLQRQGISEGIKNGASFRFMASSKNFAFSKDLAAERKRFVDENFGSDANGLIVFPNTFENIQQIHSDPKLVDPEQMKIIQTRVYDYFGTSEEILQNRSVGDAWSAYYEGKIEPFAIQLSLAMTCMAYSEQERSRGNKITWSANRLQYMTTQSKLEMSSQMFDRGVLTLNQIMDIWNLPPIDGPEGNKRYIRKEYAEISQLDEVARLQKELSDAQAQLAQQAQPPEEETEGGTNDAN